MWNTAGINPWSTFFNIFSCDLFYWLESVAEASYADDTTAYSANEKNDLVIKEKEHFSEVISIWFDFNYIKINSVKTLFLRNDKCKCYDDHTTISENKNELLGIVLDPKLSF